MASDVLRSVNRILQYQQERESRKVQESLALMQFGIQKRQADIKQYSQQMEVIDKANKQFKINIADKFIQDSGLQSLMNVIPTGIKDVDDATESLAEISKLLTKKEYGKFDKQNASNIASALWVYKNSQEPSSVINIANNFETINSPNYKGTSSDKNLLTAFNKIANMTELLNVSKQAKQSLQNDANILKEQYEFGQGDTKIQSAFGMFSPQVVNQFQQQQLQDADLSQLADEFETLEETQTNDLEYEGPSNLDKRLSDFNDLTDSIREDRKELSRLKKLDRQGFEIDKDRLKSLASDIETAKKEKASMVGIAGDVARSENIKRNVAKIEELADEILEDNDLEATEENLLIARARAADIVRRVPALQFEQSPTSLGIQRGADDSYGRIQR
jgi:hypothetical protein